jgi:hypothetical protein
MRSSCTSAPPSLDNFAFAALVADFFKKSCASVISHNETSGALNEPVVKSLSQAVIRKTATRKKYMGMLRNVPSSL